MEIEHPLMQVWLPAEGLKKHDFLLDQVLALAALDLAVTSSPAGALASHAAPDYAGAAVEYYDRSIAAYGSEPSVTEENHLAMYCFAGLTPVIQIGLRLCLPSETGGRQSALKSAKDLFELMNGAVSVAKLSWHWLKAGALPSVTAVLNQQIQLDLLDDDTNAAIARLRSINEHMHTSHHGKDIIGPSGSVGYTSYNEAIRHLEGIFAKDVDGSIRGLCMAWPSQAGDTFKWAVGQSEPFALLLLMHWGVLLDRLGGQGAWWVGETGKDLVVELSDALQCQEAKSPVTSTPEWQSGISWARQQVGLSL